MAASNEVPAAVSALLMGKKQGSSAPVSAAGIFMDRHRQKAEMIKAPFDRKTATTELRTVLPLRILIVGATGKLGSTVTRYAFEANHTVNVFIRNRSKLSVFKPRLRKKLNGVYLGDATNPADLDEAMRECRAQVVIECLADGQRPQAIKALIKTIVPNNVPTFITMGATPALLLPDGYPAGPELGLQLMAEIHLNTLALLRASKVKNWTQICPPRMVFSEDGDPSGKLVIRPNLIDLDIYTTKTDVTYEDVAMAIMNLVWLKPTGFAGSQVAFALETPPKPKLRT
mmetsp:Transcript_42987/g.97217  ORF Transcript_42987/g.97217 Transcript_42987/m.97217 type:complete len:286 (-) Transcript_42987:27-884(-)|eukprot:CAMPEP_0172633110 /NCGR_PEP_ID=MMETSP1068-20121228/187703_1 /TAXON_ID=35684 /ORGANISM="Pseudopedinella elastica, Strain CCMP716" /LENGTH=285 /DNA_ID=CAMNT_0013444717 /DNA_START=216 /DNA_END=1073 /DNA_ORIENTATION=-